MMHSKFHCINAWIQLTVSSQTQNGIRCVTWRSLSLPFSRHPLLSRDLSLQVIDSPQHSLGCDAKFQNWRAVNLTRYWWFSPPYQMESFSKVIYSARNIIMKPDFYTQSHHLSKLPPLWWSTVTSWHPGTPALLFFTASQEDQQHLRLAHGLSLFHTLHSWSLIFSRTLTTSGPVTW